MNGEISLNGSGYDINSLLDSILSNGLGSPDLTSFWVENKFEVDAFCSGIVSGMISGMDMDTCEWKIFCGKHLFVQSNACNHVFKDSDNRSSICALVFSTHSVDVVRNHSSLTIGRPSQRNNPFLIRACNGISNLDGIASCPHVLDTGAHVIVHNDMSTRSALDSSILHNFCVRLDSHTQNCQLRRSQLLSRFEFHDSTRDTSAIHRLITIRQKCVNTISSYQVNTLTNNILLHNRRHFHIHRSQNLRKHLHNSNLETPPHQLFHHLQANKARSGNNRVLLRVILAIDSISMTGGALIWNFLDPFNDGIHFLEVSQGEQPGAVDSGNGRFHGLGSYGDDEVIVGGSEGFGRSGIRFVDGSDGFGFGVYFGDSRVDANINVKPGA
mmetsp:Transcript_12271/g.25761  ORF Transcript_12271/g.25761 Transcript_12271/m.25761 type:complete len:384 (-) Transcript_12271:485-1636(-)